MGCAYQGIRNVRFSEHFTHVLNEWSLMNDKAVKFWELPFIISRLIFFIRRSKKERVIMFNKMSVKYSRGNTRANILLKTPSYMLDRVLNSYST